MSKKEIYKPRPISGFPEWLPEQRAIEIKWLDHIRTVFESYGYTNIETPAVEEMDVILAKGETDKEIYALERLQADEDDDSDARLGLHFDLTVPFARYTAQHFNELTFPFRRYQIQKVWRGERPQDGRFREFYQCDIDVINPQHLPIEFDAEMPAVIDEILQGFDIGDYTIRLNNRKILDGYLEGLGIEERQSAMRILDKQDKIGEGGVTEALQKELDFDLGLAEKCLLITNIKSTDDSFAAKVRALGVENETLEQGLDELAEVMRLLVAHETHGDIIADLSIVRGFDYYTGTVYEAQLHQFPDLGSIVSGGRYANLAGAYINRDLPGVGISLGLTRLFSKLYDAGVITPGHACPSQVFVVVPHDDKAGDARAVARTLRERGFNVEVSHRSGKIGKQLSYAEKKGIPYVWFPPFEDGRPHEIKSMKSGEQTEADPKLWTPA